MIMEKYTYTPGEDQKNHNDDSDARGAFGARPSSTVTSLGINQNVAGALTYLLGWVTGLFFLLIEKKTVSCVFTPCSL